MPFMRALRSLLGVQNPRIRELPNETAQLAEQIKQEVDTMKDNIIKLGVRDEINKTCEFYNSCQFRKMWTQPIESKLKARGD